MRFAAAGATVLAVLAPGMAFGQAGGGASTTADPCPDDLPSVRLGVQNLLKVPSRHWAREREALALARAGGGLRVLRGPSDRRACRRLLAALPRRYRAGRAGHRRYDVVFYRIRDRYLIAIQAARARDRLIVPRLPDRILSYDLEFNRVGDRVWP